MLLAQLFRFAICGVTSTLVHLVVALTVLKYLYPSATLANFVGFSIAVICSYYLNTLFVFAKNLSKALWWRFIRVNTSLMLLMTIVSAICDKFNVVPWVTVILTVTVFPLLNFMLHRYWTYQ